MSDLLSKCPIIPVVAIDNADHAVGLCQALQKGGVNAIEVTLRTEQALQAIKNIKAECPDMILGVGTVLTEADVKKSEDAGADFLVSPALSPKLLPALQATELLVLPGTASPTEALCAYDAGFEKVKLFPAEAVGGAALIKSIYAPMPKIHFMPTGGVNLGNMMSYYSLPNVYAVGGTWIARGADINAQNWDVITANCEEALAVIHNA